MNITVKNARALPWMRTMCGSDLRLDRDYGMLKVLLSNIDEDGLMYFPVTRWAVPEGTSDLTVCGTVGLAWESHYALDGHPAWLEWIRLIASGLRKAAIHVEDRAYYPPPVARASGTTRSVPLYQRDPLKADIAPKRTVKRFVADKVLPLQ